MADAVCACGHPESLHGPDEGSGRVCQHFNCRCSRWRPEPMSVRACLRFDAHTIVTRAVESGALLGWRRAHKYADGQPTEAAAVEAIVNAVMNELSEVVRWEDPTP